jgi:hypothetical protein
MDLRTAIAPTFTLSAAESFDLTFASGPSPVTVTMAARDYRMSLAPSTGTTRDYIREMTSAINTALTGAGRSEVASVFLDPATGLVDITLLASPSVTWSAGEVSGFPLRRLGFGVSIVNAVQTANATRPALYLALFVERVHVGWQGRSVVSQSETLAGVPYGIRAGIVRYEDEITLGFVPRDPDIRAAISAPQTALNPGDAYVSALATPAAREWSVLDVVAASVGQPVAFALGNWQTVSGSTSEYYDLGAIRGESIATPRIERVRDGWDRYYRITLGVTRSSTGTRL